MSETIIENWKQVIGFEGYYEVSDQGRVRRVMGGQSTKVGRLLKGGFNKAGYLFVVLCTTTKQETRLVHRVVARAFIGDDTCPHCGNSFPVDHKDGNQLNNNVGNLEYVTTQENMRRRWKTGVRDSKKYSEYV